MSIVFGLGSVKLRSYTPDKLNIQEFVPANSSIELRNKYFHLFWIPFFPLRKIWTVNVAGKQFSLPAHAEKAIEQKKREIKTPVYLFSGLIVLLGAGISISGWNTIQKQKGRNQINDLVEKDIKYIAKKIDEADTSDFFVFTKKSEPDKSCLMKVLFAEGDSMSLRMKNVKLKIGNIDSAKVVYIAGSFDSGGDTIVVSKEILKQAYQSAYSFSMSTIGFYGQDIAQNGEMYRLWAIYKIKR